MEMIHTFEPSSAKRMPSIVPCRPSLLRVVQTEILPRLLIAHRPPRAVPFASESADPERLAMLAMGPERDGAADYLSFLQRRGHSTQSLLLDLIAPAARHLGALWERDDCDFVQVTEGLGRLSAATQDLLADSDFHVGANAPGHRVLIALAPGETHRLGAEMTQGMFRFAGFDAEFADDFEARLGEAPYALLGLSISCERFLDALAGAITAARAASLNKSLVVFVGGPLVAGRADLAQNIGADACVSDASTAVLLARGLIESRNRM